MKFSALAAAALTVAAAAPALAADLPVRKSAPVMAVMSPMYNWTGFSVGVQGGWMGGAKDRVGYYDSFGNSWSNVGNLAVRGGFIGLRAGYDWQAVGSPLVVGVAGDLNYAWAKRSITPILAGVPVTMRSRNDWDGSLRLRVGYAIDRLLIYATGGLAFVHNKYDANWALGRTAGAMDSKKWHWGGTIGAGVQYAVTNNMAVGLEYRYTRYEGRTATGVVGAAGVPIGSFWTRPTPDNHRIAATLDWRF